MKAIPCKINKEAPGYIQTEVEEATHVMLNLPGLTGKLTLPIILKGIRQGTNCWSWNGSVDKPTLKPSILTSFGTIGTCHSFVNEGKVQFLSDSTHSLAGQTVDLLDVTL